MPAILSKELTAKLLGKEWSFGYNCYEVGHTWTPSCTDAALEVATAAGLSTLPLYTMLYVFSQVVAQRKYDLPASWETMKSILRSSSFIFFQAYNGTAMGCALRHSFGRFYYRILVCLPALMSSYLALAIERPARRQALAFYMLNLASEILYRMTVVKGYFKPVKYGETLVFASSLAAWYYLLRKRGFGRDPVSGAVAVLIGRSEARRRRWPELGGQVARLELGHGDNQDDRSDLAGQQLQPHHHHHRRQETGSASLNSHSHLRAHPGEPPLRGGSILNWMSHLASISRKLIDAGFNIPALGGRQPCCPHEEPSCLRYVIGPMPTRFLLGYTIQSLLRLSARPRDLLSSPGASLRASLVSGSSARFGLFLMSWVSTGRLASCLLRRHSGADLDWHAPVAGFCAGTSMLWSPKSSISMYVMWKVVEQYYLRAHLPYQDFTVASIYALSAATILYAFALEPRFVRPSYMKFLDRISDHRLHQINRMVLDVFGTGSSVGYEDYFPDLHPRFMSNQFKELVFNWMIQPYE